MARYVGCVMIAALLAVPAQAQTGSISGQVRNSAGTPQMGAMVQIMATLTPGTQTVFTDDRGHFSASSLAPGTYHVKVTAPSFLPSLREGVAVRSGAEQVVNITLSTLFEAIQLLPPRRRAADDDDDWRWTLRSMGNRPILRVLDDGPLVVVSSSEEPTDRALKARVAFVAGPEAEGFGGASDMTTAFSVEHSVFGSGTVSLDGGVGHGGGGLPAGVLRASYSRRTALGTPEVALTVRRFASPEMVAHNAALQALALTLSDSLTLMDLLELHAGGEFQTIQFRGRASAFRPFGSARLHLGPGTVLAYGYATSQPTTRLAKGFDSAPADLSESGPRMTLTNGRPELERARHQEVSLSQRLGETSLQMAYFWDNIASAALIGVGDVSLTAGDFLPDVYSGTFSYGGGNLRTSGMRVVIQRKLALDLTGTLGYAYGGVLTTDAGLPWEQASASIRTARRHSLSGKLMGSVPGTQTRWITSYQWSNGDALTPVDMFDASPGQTDPFLNIFVRQPLPYTNFLPGRMEALVDVRNLLAQGYVPVVGQDGQTLYLVQSARSVRGGLSFTF